MDQEIYEAIVRKKEFSEIPRTDVERAWKQFERRQTSDAHKIKLTRDLLRKLFSGFGGKKLLVWKDKSAEEILKKHLSTRERFSFYEEVYERILKRLPKEISVIDLGSGVNGFSYAFFEKVGKKVDYLGVEAVGQLIDLQNEFFSAKKFSARGEKGTLFELGRMKEFISEMKKPRVVFMFKVVDALEKLERNFTKTFLKEIMPLVERVVISFSTESWMKRKKFFVQRTWLIKFVKESGWQFVDDFNLGGERYLVIEK